MCLEQQDFMKYLMYIAKKKFLCWTYFCIFNLMNVRKITEHVWKSYWDF